MIGFVSLRLAYYDVLLGVPLGRILQDQVKAEFRMSTFHDQHQELDGQQRQQLTLARESMNQSMAIVMLLAERTGLDTDRDTINLSIGRKVLQTRVDFLQEAAEAIEGSKVGHTRSKRVARKLRSSFKGIRQKISNALKKRQTRRNSKNSKKTDGPDNKKTEGAEKSKPENDKPEELGKKKKSRLSSAAKAAVKTGAAVGLVAALDAPNLDTPDFDLLDFADLPGGVKGHDLLDFDAGHDEEGDEYDYEEDDEEGDAYDYEEDDEEGDDYEDGTGDDYEDGTDVQQTLNMFTISAVSVSKETKRLYTAFHV